MSVQDGIGRNRASKTGKRETRNQPRWISAMGALILGLTAPALSSAQTRYVSLSGSHTPPYTNWAMAATNIQTAVDAALTGELVLVTNGLYNTGARKTPGYSLSNRVVITKNITVQSVNGPAVTIIEGAGSIGDSPLRCVYMTAGVLSGFTLTNGHTRSSGELSDRCGAGCFVTNAVVSNCVMVGNQTPSLGGGCYGGTMRNCILLANSAYYGGGAHSAVLQDCTLEGNTSSYSGGGGHSCVFSNCDLLHNTSGFFGGGAANSTLHRCRVDFNEAVSYGGGVSSCTLYGCLVRGNSAPEMGGGAAFGSLYNCTVTDNSSGDGGGMGYGALYNCVVKENQAMLGPNYSGATLNHCCTDPMPDAGIGNITNAPLLVDNSGHLAADSPCVGAGSFSYASGSDIDGDAWDDPPSIGCDEYVPASATGSLIPSIQADGTRVVKGKLMEFTGSIEGHALSNRWNFGEEHIYNNTLAASFAWTNTGAMEVLFSAYNVDHPSGVTATQIVEVVELDSATYYVWPDSPTPSDPYTNWESAAHTIQEAVDAATNTVGALVLVTNGLYDSGCRVTPGFASSNRVVITSDITVQSVNGPEFTIIEGKGPIGGDAIRCVFLSKGTLCGFTLTNGHTCTSGHTDYDLSGGGCVVLDGVVSNCVLGGNIASAQYGSGGGGGALGGSFYNCSFKGNVAGWYGGGALSASLYDCVLAENYASWSGGGARDSTLVECVIVSNRADYSGGGVVNSYALNCVILANFGTSSGGGALNCTAYNCVIMDNTAGSGGGASGGLLQNCTIRNNYGPNGGGVAGSTLFNCVVYDNTPPEAPNYTNSTLHYCCTYPLPDSGTGNITNAPRFADSFHIAADSPCIGAGSSDYATGTDIDGDAWADPPSIGCDEYVAGSATGALSVSIQATYTRVVEGNTLSFIGNIEGHALSNRWSFGDGCLLTNELTVSHAWATTGVFEVTLSAFNLDHPLGVTATQSIDVLALDDATYHVWTNSPSPAPPYSNWMTAAHAIQDAVDAVDSGVCGARVLVTNGLYNAGARITPGYSLSNRVVITQDITVQSVNGPEVTIIEGSGPIGPDAVRCVYITNGTLIGFTLTNGHTSNNGSFDKDGSGGGAYAKGGRLDHCIIRENHADTHGGAIYQGTLQNSILNGNSAGNNGGGAYEGTLRNCAVYENTAGENGGGLFGGLSRNCSFIVNTAGNTGGGTYSSTMENSLIWHNVSANPVYSNYYGGVLNGCCAGPLPAGGSGNIDLSPILVDSMHIATDSPCIGAGSSAYADGTDIDGDAWADPPSIGCDEYVPGSATGPLSVSIDVSKANPFMGETIAIEGAVVGHALSNRWTLGDGTIWTNCLAGTHSWASTGTVEIVFSAYNMDHPSGVSATQTIDVLPHALVCHYVWTNSPSPVPPYTNWTTAARTIQEAVDAANPSPFVDAWIWVTDGVYNVGTRVTPGYALSNRVVITNNIIVQSVNGPDVTLIEGAGPLGNSAVRCVFITNGCLVGFTLTNGHTRGAGDTFFDRSGGGYYAAHARLSNCVIRGNRAALYGGGGYQGALVRCVIRDNVSLAYGGGSSGGDLWNCAVFGNRTGIEGGGAASGTLVNCTLVGNTASNRGGGACDATLYNCMAWNNHSVNTVHSNYYEGDLNYCDTAPIPEEGNGNIDQNPKQVDSMHVAEDSPCIGAGSSAYSSGTDIDGDVWADPPSIGCDEYVSSSATGPLSVTIQVDHDRLVVGWTLDLEGFIEGHALSNRWNFGDGAGRTNELSVSHAWSSPGIKEVTFAAYNLDYPTGIIVTQYVEVYSLQDATCHVWVDSPSPSPPYTNWNSAAHTIQDAVDAVDSGVCGARVLVTNGLYNIGSRLTPGYSLSNRVVISNNISVESVNGPTVTIIEGAGPMGDSAVRCVFITNGCLIGFTLTNGHTRLAGNLFYDRSGGGSYAGGGRLINCIIQGNASWDCAGGVYQGELTRCLVEGNAAGKDGGGGHGSLLRSCSIRENTAGVFGGGVSSGRLYNCTIAGNIASNRGGGAYSSTQYNCVVWHNVSRTTTYSNMYGGVLNYCCVGPLPAEGEGNIDQAPLLVDSTHIAGNSPCIGAGSFAYADETDIDGDAWSDPPSIGCDEYISGSATGALSVSIQAQYVRVLVGGSLLFQGRIDGHALSNRWNFGDGGEQTNAMIVSHSWTNAGVRDVIFTAYNLDYPEGLATTQRVDVIALENAVYYVWTNSPAPVSPYTSWTNAAHSIQDAIDAIDDNFDGATVWVTNGVYDAGAHTAPGSASSNRVIITKNIAVRSVNGPDATIIKGSGPIGDAAIRCVYMEKGSLNGFTLTNGFTRKIGGVPKESSGGGVYANNAFLSNCVLSGNTAYHSGGGSYGGTLTDCRFSGNRTDNDAGHGYGGAAVNGLLTRCAISGNVANSQGGGLYDCTAIESVIELNVSGGSGGGSLGGQLNRCSLNGNVSIRGGGATGGILVDCLLVGNEAEKGGGASGGIVASNCIIRGNTASIDGGGVYGGSTIDNSAIIGNTAHRYGGGLYNNIIDTWTDSHLNHCTINGNQAMTGGGVYGYQTYLNDCIVYENRANDDGDNYIAGEMNYCCTIPLPKTGVGNMENHPKMADSTHLSPDSPCIGAGSPTNAFGVDIDGESWAPWPSIGCDEYSCTTATGLLHLSIQSDYDQVVLNSPLTLWGSIVGHALSNKWDFGDGALLTNTLLATHPWTNNGTFDITLTAYNNDYPAGVVVTQRIVVLDPDQALYYVWTNSPAPSPPYSNWTTAARTIQEAVDYAAQTKGATILVTNGLYNSGGKTYLQYALTNRVIILTDLTVRSINGPAVTCIMGKGPSGNAAIRCVQIANGCLDGFSLINGHTRTGDVSSVESCGGGAYAYGATVSNCIIQGGSSYGHGGGIAGGTLYNCIIQGNNARMNGGGASYGALYQCVLTSNSAGYFGGGAGDSTLNRCEINGNSSASFGGGVFSSELWNCLLLHNTANQGGGSWICDLHNCTIWGNHALDSAGGSLNDTMMNCVLWNNTAGSTSYSNHMGGDFSYSCIAPLPSGGTNNIASNPLFMDAAGSNFHLQVVSPCIDAGQNEAWMADATDYEGNPRIINERVDMGVYEFNFKAGMKAWLQGPYDTNTHSMGALLSTNIPLTSPFADDPRTVALIPSNTVDWVLVQARSTPSNAPVFSRSLFLRNDGWIVNEEGDTAWLLEVSPMSSNYLCVGHRNHPMVMSEAALWFTNQSFTYDFTPDAGPYFGGTNGAVELEPGAWGLMAGDADADGRITAVDQAIAEAQLGQNGYKCGDYDLDGLVSSNDVLRFFPANLGRQSAAPNREIALKPSLTVTPGRKTLLTESSVLLSVSGATNLQWFMIDHPSGGSLGSQTATSILYQAGTTSSCVDIVEAWDGDYRFGRSYLNVISSGDIALAGKAVILAGCASESDPLWEATDYLAKTAFNTLTYRGFSEDNIQYVSAVSNSADVDLPATYANVEQTFTNWIETANRLFVFMADHGIVDGAGASYFRLNASETLPVVDLDGWLDDFQNAYQKDVVIVIDSCYAEALMNDLSYTGTALRIVIAAAKTNEPAYFIAGGLVSFSDAFFSGILAGNDVDTAFKTAKSAMSPYQESTYYDNAGGSAAQGYYLGATFVSGKDVPQIGLVCGNQLLDRSTVASLWAADVVSAYPIDRVWCMVVPPSHSPTNPANPVQDIPEVELTYSPVSGRYQGSYNGFGEEGVYKVLYYAMDNWGSVSLPRQSYVEQWGYDERIILVAGGPSNSPRRAAIDYLAGWARHCLLARGFDTNSIRMLGAESAMSCTLSNLQSAIIDWAAPSDRLTVYLVGEGSNSLFCMNNAEGLSGYQLQEWLNVYQISNRVLNTIMDYDGAGAMIPYLVSPENRERIVLASTRADAPCLMEAEGRVSFSQYFWNAIFQGHTIGTAFDLAKRAVWFAGGMWSQSAQLDDTGNGISNEKELDRVWARTEYLGPAYRTGNAPPIIGSVIPDTELPGTNALLLWAADILDVDGLSNVWCTITGPEFNGSTGITVTALSWNGATARYENYYEGFTEIGLYICTFHAEDNKGEVSLPRQTLVRTVTRDVIAPDAYEVDDTPIDGKPICFGEVQAHTLHISNDVDWVFLYVADRTNQYLTVKTEHVTNTIDTVIDIYTEDENGALTLFRKVDEEDSTLGESWGWYPDATVYYIKISSTNYRSAGGYELSISTPSAGPFDSLLVLAQNGLTAEALPVGVKAHLHTGAQMSFNGSQSVNFAGPPDGYYTVTLTDIPEGWRFAANCPSSRVVHVPWKSGCDYYAQFILIPCFQIAGSTRDTYTGEWLPTVKMELKATSGKIAGQKTTTNWYTQASGALPDEAYGALVNWEATFSKTDYSNAVLQLPGASQSPGDTYDCGHVLMNPVVSNPSGLPDVWVNFYFGGSVNPDEDEDEDGSINRDEYFAGTDPTNEASVLAINDSLPFESDFFHMRWPVASGRLYRLDRSDGLFPPDWQTVYGPITAASDESWMEWTDTNAVSEEMHFYRVVLPIP